MRRYAVHRAAGVARDIARIRRHLVQSYESFGDSRAIATDRADARIRDAFGYMTTFATHPHRGTLHKELRGDVRHVTERQFVYYFEVNDQTAEVRIIAVFFGGEDHLEHVAQLLRD